MVAKGKILECYLDLGRAESDIEAAIRLARRDGGLGSAGDQALIAIAKLTALQVRILLLMAESEGTVRGSSSS